MLIVYVVEAVPEPLGQLEVAVAVAASGGQLLTPLPSTVTG
jgi:hypothetical protein